MQRISSSLPPLSLFPHIIPHSLSPLTLSFALSHIPFQPSIGMHLPELVQPVLTCFEDPDARVRYYACESLYNISKVARGAVLVFFNSTFDGLCKVRDSLFHVLCSKHESSLRIFCLFIALFLSLSLSLSLSREREREVRPNHI